MSCRPARTDTGRTVEQEDAASALALNEVADGVTLLLDQCLNQRLLIRRQHLLFVRVRVTAGSVWSSRRVGVANRNEIIQRSMLFVWVHVLLCVSCWCAVVLHRQRGGFCVVELWWRDHPAHSGVCSNVCACVCNTLWCCLPSARKRRGPTPAVAHCPR